MEFRDLKAQYNQLKKEIDKSILKVIENTNFISGKEVEELEKKLAEYVGVKHCISCANGTDALSLVLRALDIKQGDAVFVPNFTFFATAEVVAYAKATVVFVDVDVDTFNIDTVDLENKIKEVIEQGEFNPKVIIPVDLFGLSANYIELERIAKKYELYILEDAAQGFGGSINGRKNCSFGIAATTSFFPAKPLGCYGDGGAIFTNDDKIAELIYSYRVHGKGTSKYDNVRIGVNSRLDTIQAAILKIKLDAFIKYELDAVNKAYELYTNLLKDVVVTPYIPKGYISSFAQYTIRLKDEATRDRLKKELEEYGIPTMIYYAKTMHQQKAFESYNKTDDDYPNSSLLCKCVLSLPMHPYLKEEEIKFIASKIINILE